VNLKLLQLAQVGIGERSTGSRIRNYYLASQLAKVMKVTHLGFGDDAGMMEPQSPEGMRIRLVPRERAYTIAKLVRGALGTTPVTLLNFESPVMAAALTAELAAFDYDTVLIEGIEMAPYLPIIRTVQKRARYLVLDWHNIESEVVERHSRHAATPFHRLLLQRTSSQLKRVENDLLDSCDLHLVTSERDRRTLLSRRPSAKVMIVENGVDVRHFAADAEGLRDQNEQRARYRLLFVGSMDYSANADAAEYFAEEVWPRLHRSFPQLVFTIVGRNPPEKIRAMGARAGTEVTGTVADVRPYYREAIAAVVPLRVAGGTRLKILEAMAAGVPVVSTTVGAEGLRVEPEVHFMLADTPAEFHVQIERLCGDPALCRRVSAAGRMLIEGTYDWEIIGARLIESYVHFFEPQKMSGRGHHRSVRVA
jgi:glycosyltransferase involved in cell wall biosynthesis